MAQLIVDLDPQLSDSLDADRFLIVIMAIDGKQQIGDKSGEDLHHQSVLCSCDKVIDFKVAFPPCEELLNLPSQFVDESDLLG